MCVTSDKLNFTLEWPNGPYTNRAVYAVYLRWPLLAITSYYTGTTRRHTKHRCVQGPCLYKTWMLGPSTNQQDTVHTHTQEDKIGSIGRPGQRMHWTHQGPNHHHQSKSMYVWLCNKAKQIVCAHGPWVIERKRSKIKVPRSLCVRCASVCISTQLIMARLKNLGNGVKFVGKEKNQS